jgi:hypothetical protein
VLMDAKPLPFRPCPGRLGFFRPRFCDSADDAAPRSVTDVDWSPL